MKIGYVLKLVRTVKGMSQGEMAELLGISQNYLSLIESNKKGPSADKIKEFADALKVSEHALVFAASEVPTELSSEDKKQFRKLQQNILSLLLFKLNGELSKIA
ncbi:MAG: helix-turn-helix transcriptional regulator [Deltaproteobacteria bacterium]|nr:helix-turn-helix transcriptional regulator [Deltaproteobacteria bacterium]